MGKLVYGMSVSADGYVEDADGSIEFSAPDDAVHQLANEQARAASAFLFGRRLYELMEGFWPTALDEETLTPVAAEFAQIYVATPRIVFSDTLRAVPAGVRLVRRADAVDEITRLKRETEGALDLGGPTLAASVIDLIDEFRMFVVPKMLHAGKPYLPDEALVKQLRMIDHRVFDSGTVYRAYARHI